MKTETIIANIIEEVRNRTCIDNIDKEIIEEILQDSLNEYSTMLDGYSDGHSAGYTDGHYDGYADGYYMGYADGRSAV